MNRTTTDTVWADRKVFDSRHRRNDSVQVSASPRKSGDAEWKCERVHIRVSRGAYSPQEVEISADMLTYLIDMLIEVRTDLAGRGIRQHGQPEEAPGVALSPKKKKKDLARALLNAVEAAKATTSRVEIAGVVIEPCDAYGKSLVPHSSEED